MSIFSEYNSFRYIYPPRAECAIDPSTLDDIADDWIAQPKYNGSCAVLFIDGQKEYKIYNRHGEPLKLQRPIDYLRLNDSQAYMVLCGEYLNKNKQGEDGKTFNHKFIIWDILVWKGTYLIGRTLEQRLTILHLLFGTHRSCVNLDGLSIYNHLFTTSVPDVYMAPSYQNGFKSLYKEIIQTDLYEGLVIKKASAKLEAGFRENNNASWQVKARKGTKNYGF
jgi:ATP-dependent DNA ligase